MLVFNGSLTCVGHSCRECTKADHAVPNEGIPEGIDMNKNGLLERVSAVLVLVSAALVVCGTRACQEDYALGSQVRANNTGTATPTEDGDIVTATPTAINPSPTVTAGPTDGARGTATRTTAPTVAAGLFQELSVLSERSPDAQVSPAVARSQGSAKGNWLGEGFSGDNNDSQDGWVDSDGDGFSDALELSRGSSADDSMSVPAGVVSTRLDQRVRAFDSDLDGVSTGEELRLGTDPNSSDSDGDKLTDGAEVLSGGNPLAADDRYLDRDGDGLSDDYERENSLNPDELDSDGDGLRDDLEIVVGSNGRNPDSDGDGISDGKEFDLGSDPTVPEGEK